MLPDRLLFLEERQQHAAVLIKKSTNQRGNLAAWGGFAGLRFGPLPKGEWRVHHT
jgi:hypothetical protein